MDMKPLACRPSKLLYTYLSPWCEKLGEKKASLPFFVQYIGSIGLVESAREVRLLRIKRLSVVVAAFLVRYSVFCIEATFATKRIMAVTYDDIMSSASAELVTPEVKYNHLTAIMLISKSSQSWIAWKMMRRLHCDFEMAVFPLVIMNTIC